MAEGANFSISTNAITLGAKDAATARKYLSFLRLHSMFGGHVGLHESIRNEEANRSLDSTRGTYDMLDVYTTPGTSVEAGMLVNFVTDNEYNPLGETLVYPVTDTSRPLGYMVTKAFPDKQGICVVNGILEVPLNYTKGSSESEIEIKDFVEYDIDAGAFNFSDSGYPVYNVYQDVDGDWIAIILFGNTSVDISGSTDSWEYDGSFKVSKDSGYPDDPFHMFYVTCNGGDVVINGKHFTCPVLGYTEFTPESENEDLEFLEDYQDNVVLSTGESLWLAVELRGDTVGFNYFDSSDIPIDGDTVFNFKLAEHNNDDNNPGIKQIQYGDIYHNFTKVLSGSDNVHITPEVGTGNIEISVDMPEVINDYYGPFKATVHTHAGGSVSGFTVDGYTGTFVRNPIDDGYGNTYDGITTNFYQWSSFDDDVSFWTRTLDVQEDMPLYYLDGGGIVTPANKTVYIVYEAKAFDVIIKDSSDRREVNPDTGNVEDLAGCVVLGNGSYINVFGATVNCDLADRIYLVGSSAGFSFVVADSYEELSSYPLSVFVAMIGGAVGEGGLPYIEQEIFGDVVVASLGGGGSGGDLTVSVSDNTASIGITGSTHKVKLIAEEDVYIKGGTNTDEVIVGSTCSYEYDGEFAFHVSSKSGTTLTVTRNDGYVVTTGTRTKISGTTVGDSLQSGKAVWLKFNVKNFQYSITIANSESTPSAVGEGETWFKLAENNGGVLKQIQYGELTAPGVRDITGGEGVEVTRYTNGKVEINATGGGGGFEYAGGFAVLPVDGSTTTVNVCDSTNLSGSTAGFVSIGTASYPANIATVTMGTNTSLFFEAWYTDSIGSNNVLFNIGTNDAIVYRYTTSINTTLPREWHKRLASKDSNGVIKQVHLTDNLEIVGRWS